MSSWIIKLASRVAELLDNLTPVKYNRIMSKKPIITPERFDAIKEVYDEAVQKRQEEIKRLYYDEGWGPQRIAKHLRIDISQVSRFIARLEKESSQ